jgi:hypothetical protein
MDSGHVKQTLYLVTPKCGNENSQRGDMPVPIVNQRLLPLEVTDKEFQFCMMALLERVRYSSHEQPVTQG